MTFSQADCGGFPKKAKTILTKMSLPIALNITFLLYCFNWFHNLFTEQGSDLF